MTGSIMRSRRPTVMTLFVRSAVRITRIAVAGGPGIDPVVYFKMLLMASFFEGISSKRGIVARCSDSVSIRHFLPNDLSEPTPDHSSLTRVRQRLDLHVFDDVFALILLALNKAKLVKGRKLASMRR